MKRLNKKAYLAVFDALVFLTIVGLVSASITVAVMNKRENNDLHSLRNNIDDTTAALGIIQQFCIEETYYVNETGIGIPLEDKNILELLEFILLNRELNKGYGIKRIQDDIYKEIQGCVQDNFLLRTEANNHPINIPNKSIPEMVIATSTTTPAGPILGNVTVSLYIW